MTTSEAPPAERWIEYRRPEDLPPDPSNAKGHDGDFIMRSIVEQGVIELQVLDERTGLLISGHGRRKALIAAEQSVDVKAALAVRNLQTPDGVRLDDEGRWLVPVVRGWASRDDDHATAALIGLNRGVERGGWELQGLSEALESLDSSSVGIDLAGYERADLDVILQDLGVLGDRAGGFLDDLASQHDGKAPIAGARPPQFDGVELRFACTPAQRDEAVALLRSHQRRLGAETLTDTLLGLLREKPITSEQQ